MSIKNNLDILKTQDIYSLILFILYKLMGTPEYSSLSELAYVLDKDNLLNLCEYFGGQTITIPTIDELKSLAYALSLYQQVKMDKVEYNIAIKSLNVEAKNIKNVKTIYNKMCEILNNYNFNPRGNNV